MKLQEKILLILLSVFWAVPFLLTSCGKKKEKPPGAIISVVDSLTKKPVDSLKVRLHLDGHRSTISGYKAVPPDPDTKYTDDFGQVTWTIKSPASYFAEVTSTTSNDTAEKLVTFRTNEVVEVTIEY